MKAIIKLKIERFEEHQEEYFVATSDDIQGLVAEGKTIEETVAIAEDLAHILLEQDMKQKSVEMPAIPNKFEYPLIIEV